MIRNLASLVFYGRFLNSFSVLGFNRRSRHWEPLAWNFTGQRWIVTGATGGIGRALVLAGLEAGAEVWAIARDPAKLAALKQAASHPDRLYTEQCDLSSLVGVRQLAEGTAFAGLRIDALINNVGVLLNDFSRSEEGLEMSLATNLLGHFVLTESLVEQGVLGTDATVIEVSSGGMYGTPLTLDDMFEADSDGWDGMRAYAFHKRAQVELVRAWNRRWPDGPTCQVMHPGWVDTAGVQSSLPRFRATLRKVLRTPEQGADTLLWLMAERPAWPEEGGIWLDRQLDSEHAFCYTRRAYGDADELYELLVALTAP
ncbi:MAG: SDR family NAD(P)-dependent oxidoreductase [Pseudomonadota bacterium]